VGLLDYYKQFDAMSEEEVNAELREQAAQRKRDALAKVEPLDLSQTTWHELPNPRIANAITFVARRGMHRYPQDRGRELQEELARLHDVPSGRLILGNGAAELLGAATRALLGAGQSLITRWPSYPLYPLMARRASAEVTAVDDGGVEALLDAARKPGARAIVIASPNDPTGELTAAPQLRWLLEQIPDGVAVLLDEALVDFADAQPTDASIALLEEFPRLLVFRSFSKAWGLAGTRVGYAIGGPGSEQLLAELDPDLGVSELSQAGALEAIRSCGPLIEERVRRIGIERPLLAAQLRERGFDVTASQANFLWASHPRFTGSALARELLRHGITVASGEALGAAAHCRITLRSEKASKRLLRAIDQVLAVQSSP
jgi:histidinol-phosphate aminotransferase